MNEEFVEESMGIILSAGDARNCCKTVLDCIAEAKFEEAESELEKAQRFILEAHQKHTDMLQREGNGEKIEYSLLFAHAQDTMMTVNSEIILTKQLLKKRK